MKNLVIDLGGTAMKYCLMDENAEIFEKHSIPAPLGTPENFLNTIAETYEQYKDQVEGIAISMPGFVDPATGYLAGGGAYFSLWQSNVYDLLRQKISCPISIENDGKSGALAEIWKGALTEVKDAAVIIIGTGIAGGLIKDRRIHRGHQLTAGEFSFIPTDPDRYDVSSIYCSHTSAMGLCYEVCLAKHGDITLLDNYQLLEAFFPKKEIEAAKNTPVPDELKGVVIDGFKVFQWIEEKDPVVLQVYQSFIRRVAWLANVVEMIYDPELIAIGGGISREKRLVEDIQKAVDAFGENLGMPAPKVKLVNCKFFGDANLYGAMYNYMIHHHPDWIQ